MSAHTPGPWSAKPSGRIVEIWKDGHWLASAFPTFFDGAERMAANAALIAAAPDLLAALRMVTETCGPPEYWNGETRAFLEAAYAAIAKAERAA
jgi:hypothetical protein